MNDTMTRELADAAKRCDTPAAKVIVLNLTAVSSTALPPAPGSAGRHIADRADSSDGREGVDAFLTKRRPEFA